jgi:hypothetical protein
MRLLCLAALLAACAAALTSTASAASPDATAAKGCSVGDSRSYGTTYVLKISVSGTSCRSGKRLIRAFHECRPGKSGRCSRVKRYDCSESRFDRISTQYSSRVTCKRGDRVVKHTYQQFT